MSKGAVPVTVTNTLGQSQPGSASEFTYTL